MTTPPPLAAQREERGTVPVVSAPERSDAPDRQFFDHTERAIKDSRQTEPLGSRRASGGADRGAQSGLASW
jgi:hypothetical protein